MASGQNNDQRLLDRILEDQQRKLAPEKSRDDFFTFFAADKALQDWDLDNDEISDGIVDGAHDCGIDGIWTFVDDRYITTDAHQYLPHRARTIDLVILQAKNTSGYQETVIEKLHFHLPTLLDMGREEDELIDHTNAKLLDRTRRFLRVLEELASSFPQVRIKVIYASKAAESPHPNVKSKGTVSAASWTRSPRTRALRSNISTPPTYESALLAERRPLPSWCSPRRR